MRETAPRFESPKLVWPDGKPAPGAGIRFTIATLVTDHAQYEAMRASFRAGGFAAPDCEWIKIDNTGAAQTDAFRGLNAALAEAQGAHVILCHQDVRLLADDRASLETCLADLETRDPKWAVAGNAGGVAPGELALRISDPHGTDRKVGTLPARVMSLDENFLVVKRAHRVGFSADLEGFHFYGPDIVLNAAVAGYSAYVIDFHLMHLSGGVKGPSFFEAKDAFRAKWNKAFGTRWMQTTCALVLLSGDAVGQIAGRIAERPYGKLMRRSRGWPG